MADSNVPGTSPAPASGVRETPRATLTGHEPPLRKSPDASRAFHVIGTILRIPLLPFIFILRPLIFRTSQRAGTQIALFTSFNGLVYCWPIVAVGYIGAALLAWGWVSPEVMGWIWILTILLVIIVLGADVSRNAALMWILAIGLLLAVGGLVNAYYNVPVLRGIYGHFDNLNVIFDNGTVIAMCELLLIILAFVAIHSLSDGRHEISSREVTHRHFLRTSESWPLNINRVRLDWPDLLEMLVLFGAGHLVIIDQQGREVLRIPNIPFLWFYRDEVNRILDIMATTEVSHHDAAAAGAGRL